MAADELVVIVDRHVASLMEYCEAVQILVTRRADDGGTEGCARGGGNWYARRGMAQEFVERDNASTIADFIRPEN